MINEWTEGDIEEILKQLNERHLPFRNYALKTTSSGLKLLGKGAAGNVYPAYKIKNNDSGFAIKVTGFRQGHIDVEKFYRVTDEQQELSLFEKRIVRIYDAVALRIYITGENTVTEAELIKKDEVMENRLSGNYLDLGFVLMEKMVPVIQKGYAGNPEIFSVKLEEPDEEELMRFAYDIGSALREIHGRNCIHRDVKLENIFYSPKDGKYKIGDFGIAGKSDDGFFDLSVYTKGYGAPEVIASYRDRYDRTADIYSFGMTLYVIMNELRFPESKEYRALVDRQYRSGYAAPVPSRGNMEMKKLVLKMISFDPDDRFQSLDEFLNELDGLKYGRYVKYQREHSSVSLAFGLTFLITGFLSVKTGVFAMPKGAEWMSALLIILGCIMFFEHEFIKTREEFKISMIYIKNHIWILAGAMFVGLMWPNEVNYHICFVMGKIFGVNVSRASAYNDAFKIGLSGLLFSLAWLGRKIRITMLLKHELKKHERKKLRR